MQVGDRKIWGVTALILRSLYERVHQDHSTPARPFSANFAV